LLYCSKYGANIKQDDKFNVYGTPATKTIKGEFSVSADNLIARVKELLYGETSQE